MGSGSSDCKLVEPGRWQAARREAETLLQKCELDRARARAIRAQVRLDRSQRQLVRAAGWAWPGAGRGCIPVVEQAKGVVMFRQGCGPDEAFDLLRWASQRASVRVHVLAAQLVEHVGDSQDGSSVTPISLGAIMGLQEARAWLPDR